MHVFENTKIWDAAKSLHLYFWACKPEIFSHPDSSDTDKIMKAITCSKKHEFSVSIDKTSQINPKLIGILILLIFLQYLRFDFSSGAKRLLGSATCSVNNLRYVS